MDLNVCIIRGFVSDNYASCRYTIVLSKKNEHSRYIENETITFPVCQIVSCGLSIECAVSACTLGDGVNGGVSKPSVVTCRPSVFLHKFFP